MRLDFIPNQEMFESNGRIYVILRKEGNMTEVVDDNGKKWAWPTVAEVTVEIVNDAFKHPIRKAK